MDTSQRTVHYALPMSSNPHWWKVRIINQSKCMVRMLPSADHAKDRFDGAGVAGAVGRQQLEEPAAGILH